MRGFNRPWYGPKGVTPAINGSAGASLPAMATALVAAEKTRRTEVTTLLSATNTIRVGLSSTLNVTIPRADSQEGSRGWDAALALTEHYVEVTLTPNGANHGCVHGSMPDQWTLSWARGVVLGAAEPDLRWRTCHSEVVENTAERVRLRVPRAHMRIPMRRGPGKRKTVEATTSTMNAADALTIKDLVQAINSHVGVDDGLQLSVDPTTGRLKATIMVEFE